MEHQNFRTLKIKKKRKEKKENKKENFTNDTSYKIVHMLMT